MGPYYLYSGSGMTRMRLYCIDLVGPIALVCQDTIYMVPTVLELTIWCYIEGSCSIISMECSVVYIKTRLLLGFFFFQMPMAEIPVLPSVPLSHLLDSGTDTDVYMACGIDGHSVLLGGRFRLAGAHEGQACIQAQNPFSHTQRLSLAFESGITCVDDGRGREAMVHRRCVQRVLCDNVMDKSEFQFASEMISPDADGFRGSSFTTW
jgi:hypothetical protein